MPIIGGKFVKDGFGVSHISSKYDGKATYYHQKSGVYWETMGIPCRSMDAIQTLLLNERAEKEAKLSGRPLMIIN